MWLETCIKNQRNRLHNWYKFGTPTVFLHSSINLGFGNVLLSYTSVFVLACFTNSVALLDLHSDQGTPLNKLFELDHWQHPLIEVQHAMTVAKSHRMKRINLDWFNSQDKKKWLCSKILFEPGFYDLRTSQAFAKLFFVNPHFRLLNLKTFKDATQFLFMPKQKIIEESKKIINNKIFTSVQIRAYHIPLNSHIPTTTKDIGTLKNETVLFKFIDTVSKQNTNLYISTDNFGVIEEFKKRNVSIMYNPRSYNIYRNGYASDVAALVDMWSLRSGQSLIASQHSTFGAIASFFMCNNASTSIFLNNMKIQDMNDLFCLHIMNKDFIDTVNCPTKASKYSTFHNEYNNLC